MRIVSGKESLTAVVPAKQKQNRLSIYAPFSRAARLGISSFLLLLQSLGTKVIWTGCSTVPDTRESRTPSTSISKNRKYTKQGKGAVSQVVTRCPSGVLKVPLLAT